MSTKSANLYIRIEPEVKEEAEKILSELGISPSSAINMFYKQVILRKGLPFDVVLHSQNKKETAEDEKQNTEEVVFAKLR